MEEKSGGPVLSIANKGTFVNIHTPAGRHQRGRPSFPFRASSFSHGRTLPVGAKRLGKG